MEIVHSMSKLKLCRLSEIEPHAFHILSAARKRSILFITSTNGFMTDAQEYAPDSEHVFKIYIFSLRFYIFSL